MNRQPPRLPLRLLRWFCSEERLEELEGDLFEVYQDIAANSPRLAGLQYWLMVIRSFRFYALQNSKQKTLNSMTNFFILLRHQFKLIVRQLWKQKTFAALNIIGLAIGLAGFIAIYSLIRYETSFNHHFPDKERIYRLYSQFTGEWNGHNRGVPLAVGPYLKHNKQESIEEVTQFISKTLSVSVNSEKQQFPQVKGTYADSMFFRFFREYDWLAGDEKRALTGPHKVVITSEQAEKYFGRHDPRELIGQTITYLDSLSVTISGVVRRKGGNSDFVFTDFISLETIDNSWLKDRYDLSNWQSTNSGTQVWIKARREADYPETPEFLSGLNDHLNEVVKDDDVDREIRMRSLEKMHYDDQLGIMDNRGRAAADLKMLSGLAVISIALLLMAIFNFINMVTARASSYAKEVGIKKVLGSDRLPIFTKFIMEGMLITFLSLLIAFPLAQAAFTFLDEFFPTDMPVTLWQFHYLPLLIILTATVGFFAGFYPALRISGISIGKALKANARLSFAGKGTPMMRKVLVSFQFVCSQVLIIIAITVFLQLRYMLNKDMGFNSESVMYLYTPWKAGAEKKAVFENELAKIPGVSDIIWQSEPPASNNYSSNIYVYNGGASPVKTTAYKKTGQAGYLDFYDIDLVAGSSVQPVENLDEAVINETYCRELGFEEAEEVIGKVIENDYDEKYTIVGVMKDFHNLNMKSEVPPVIFLYHPTDQCLAFKVSPAEGDRVIAQVSELYKTLFPKSVPRILDVDSTIAGFYRTEQQVSKLSVLATMLAIIISGMGLFGLMSISILQKTKEVGIRKVLGAGAWSLGQVIARDFVWLILVAFVIATPLAYLYLQSWLSEFAYQASLGWWVYLLGGLLTLLIAFLVTGIKLLKAVSANPIDSLRYE